MNYQFLIYEKSQDIAKITLNSPRNMNALGLAMVGELLEVLDDVRADSSVKVVILTGSGKGFSAGGDVKLMEQGLSVQEAREWVDNVGKLVLAIAAMEKLVIASVNGPAYGAGCNLALACDLIVASEEAIFCEVFARIGLIPDAGGTYLLPRLVGMARAKELIFTTKELTAQEAKELGMIQYVVSKEMLEETTKELAVKLAQNHSPAIGITKKLMLRGFAADFARALEDEAVYQALCMETREHKDKIREFLEKRKK